MRDVRLRNCTGEQLTSSFGTPFVSGAADGGASTHQQPRAMPPLGLTSRHPEPQALLRPLSRVAGNVKPRDRVRVGGVRVDRGRATGRRGVAEPS